MAYAYLHVEHEIHSNSETDIKHRFPIVFSFLPMVLMYNICYGVSVLVFFSH